MTREQIEQAIKCCNPYDEDCGSCPFHDLPKGRCFEVLAKTAFNVLLEDREKLQKQVKEYQDKIEQGTLIELPCKVGDTVCKYYKVENGIKIYSGTVVKIEMRKNGVLIYITNLPNFYYEKAFIGDLTKGYIDTTCYYFCPIEEAEKRLKEIQE